MEDIANGVDVHQFTADVIGCSRQEAKAHTFKPLYGGIMGNENEKRYYIVSESKPYPIQFQRIYSPLHHLYSTH